MGNSGVVMVGSVDVVLLTKDSERVLIECVESIYRNVPVGQLIVVDGYSKDKTLEILPIQLKAPQC